VAAEKSCCWLELVAVYSATSDHELFDQMTELYPHWVANQSWLMFGFTGA
jgi:hypothetical protein